MRSALLLILPLLVFVGLFAAPAEKSAAAKTAPAFRLDKRLPWTTSRVAGSPEPPHPYRTVRAFPDLKLTNPIGVAHLPGTKQLLLLHQSWACGGKGRIVGVFRYTVDRKTHHIVKGSQKLIVEWLSNGHNGGDVASRFGDGSEPGA